MPVICAIDYAGRAVLGEVCDYLYPELPPVLSIDKPVILIEVPKGQIVNLKLVPILHTFDVPTIKVKWTAVFPVDDRLASSYYDTIKKHSAARAGIEVVGSV